jgi:inorganic pyrophosphatase
MPGRKKQSKVIKDPEHLRPRQHGTFNVVIETPRGSHNKYKWDDTLGAYTLAKVLPAGMSFPFDFGFIPRTKAEDGDAIDVLVLMDEPAFPGCVVPCRLIGTIEACQTEGNKAERNDRLIGVAERSTLYEHVKNLADLSRNLLAEIEEFFINYNQQSGKEFKVLGRKGPNQAQKSVFTSQRAFSRAR